MSTEAIRR
jgi:hypothetical protein